MQDTQEQHMNECRPEEQTDRPPVIEGEVITTIMLDPPSINALSHNRCSLRQKLFVVAWAMVTLLLLGILVVEHAASLVAVFLAPTATITISPTLVTLQGEHLAIVPSRRLTVTSPTQTTSMRTTGIGYIPATPAHGLLTFYNAATFALTIAAGTIVTGSDGIAVVTDGVAFVPAGNPPTFGVVTVEGHTLQVGTGSNIAAGDINTLCCVAGMSVKNTEGFTGGMNKQRYPMVSLDDIATASQPFISTLTQSAKKILYGQVRASEEIAALTCSSTRTANPQQGEQATEFTVAVSVTCQAFAFATIQVNEQVASLLEKKAAQSLGSQYAEIGSVITSIVSITTIRGNTIHLVVNTRETWIYTFSASQLHQLANAVKGKKAADAKALLLSVPGVREVHIVSASILPTNSDQIQISELVG